MCISFKLKHQIDYYFEKKKKDSFAMLCILGIEIIKFQYNWSKKKKATMTRCTKRHSRIIFFIRLISLAVIIIWKGTFVAKSMNLGDNGLYPNSF